MKQIESEIQVLEPSYISAYAFSDAPTGKTYKISSPVENMVIDQEAKREKVDKLKERLWDMAKERLYLQYKVEEVEAYLTALGAEERFIIEQYFFERLSEPMIASKYQKQFNIYKNIRTLRRKRFDAIRKMESISKSTKCPQNVLKMS
jgi:alcohol dehydrogenase YqhD (iron-dependent ADH family)